MRLKKCSLPTVANNPFGQTLLDHGSDVTVLHNQASALRGFPDGDVHHGPSQVVGPNDLVGEQHAKRGVDHAQKAVAQIRFLSRLHGIDVCGPEDENAREPSRK